MKSDWKDMLSSVYALAADGKNYLYDIGLVDSVQVGCPVLSVGNLSMGGTGKTPVVQKILSLAIGRGIKPGVVARNYQARSRGIQRVNIRKPDGASYYGDEPFFLGQTFQSTSVWTGPQKYLTAQQATRAENLGLIVVDDGFQHRNLHRDFDLVLIDCTSDPEEDFLVPKGHLRESFSSLHRASAVALTKVNWAAPERVAEIRAKIPTGVEVYEIEFHSTLSKPLEADGAAIVVSGIAKPQVLTKTLQAFPNLQVREHLRFSDHYAYQMKDAHRIEETMRKAECRQILTTEKDFVKLQVFSEIRDFLNPIKITTEFREEPKGLYAFLDRTHRH
jgi:tetraacyldisaccharide 4'-kinase